MIILIAPSSINTVCVNRINQLYAKTLMFLTHRIFVLIPIMCSIKPTHRLYTCQGVKKLLSGEEHFKAPYFTCFVKVL